MFARIVAAAAIVGALSGLLLTGLQQFAISPSIRAAEVREAAAAKAHGAHGSAPDAHVDAGWSPKDALTLGVSKANNAAELGAAIDVALSYDEEILAEAAIVGREIEVAVLGSLHPDASRPGEVVPGAEFYSYADKYEDGSAELLAPAPLSETATAEVRALALRAFAACRCEGMARVDFFYDEGGRGFLVNELNTIPGFTPISMYPRLWEVSGLSYPALLDRLIELAIERHDRRAARVGRQR